MSEVHWNDESYEAITNIVAARTGLAFRTEQRANTLNGIESSMRRAGFVDPAAFARVLSHDGKILDDLIVELTVGETYFFREPDQFEVIRNRVLPELVERREPFQRMRIWSAACASGEEPYSLAMLCHKAGLAQRCDILATDISSEALRKAQQAAYREWSLRGKAAAAARSYLHHNGSEYLVDPRITAMVRFEFLNLALDVYPSTVTSTESLDLILCRNVLIYFDQETVQAVARRLYRSLAEGGWLITASGDPSLAGHAPFDVVVTDFGVFYRRQGSTQTLTNEAYDFEQEWPAEEERPHIRASARTEGDDGSLDRSRDLVTERQSSLTAAQSALACGDYARAIELGSDDIADTEACVLVVKATANLSTTDAIAKCEAFAAHHPLAAELHYLQAVLLMEVNQDAEAVKAAQRAIFIDKSLAIVHFLVGTIWQRRGSLQNAQRSFRNALTLCESCSPDDILAFTDGETAGDLIQVIHHHLRIVEDTMERST